MPLQATSGAASYDAFGGGVPVIPNYIEDVFSTWLYTGNGTSQTITNGIDVSGKGGLVWIKARNNAASHALFDTNRGANVEIKTNTTGGNDVGTQYLTAFTTSGFSVGSGTRVNSNTWTYTSWTFREQPKFFDVVTYTGNGTSRTVTHNLGSTPGCIIIKRTDSSGTWRIWHRSLAAAFKNSLNFDALEASNFDAIDSTNSTNFVVSNSGPTADLHTNINGATYIAYLFAHDSGGFGLTGADNVISCGSYTGNGSATGPVISLGYEPQWLMIKRATGTGNWQMLDNMRGLPVGSADATLQANLIDAESSVDYASPTATGFQIASTGSQVNTSSSTYIYIAIRRGPMKVPTTGTSVLGLSARTGTGANATVTGNAGVTDLAIIKNRGSNINWIWTQRLLNNGYLSSNSTAAQTTASTTALQTNPWDVMDGVKVGTISNFTNSSGNTFINYLFNRAPGFMDVVCYTGTGSARTVAHNLTVAPELMIIKKRSATDDWAVYAGDNTDFLLLNTTAATADDNTYWNDTGPTSTVLSVGTNADVNTSAATYVAYLFATCPGVSKVGSYTGNGITQAIDCGFTGGARFVLIKRTDSTGDWFVYDTARGMTVLTDPYLLLNSTAAETATLGSVITSTGGFTVNASILAAINASGGSYIFLAIA